MKLSVTTLPIENFKVFVIDLALTRIHLVINTRMPNDLFEINTETRD